MKFFSRLLIVLVTTFFSTSAVSESQKCVDKREWAREDHFFNGVRWDPSKPKSEKGNFPGPPPDTFTGKVTEMDYGKVVRSWNIKNGKPTSYETYPKYKNILLTSVGLIRTVARMVTLNSAI